MDDNFLLNKPVLVLEDNSLDQSVVKQALFKLGGVVDVVSNGSEAIQTFKHKKYDLIIIDLQMPGINGYEFAQYIRDQLKSNIPIVAILDSDSEDEKKYYAGINASLARPLGFEGLKITIKNVLSFQSSVSNNPYILSYKDVDVDISMLHEVAADDAAYRQLMIETFLESMPHTLSKIERSYREEDYESLYSAAHYAKSSLSVIKINEMFEWVQKIEAVAKRKTDLEVLPDLIEKLKTRFSVATYILSAKFLPS